MIKYIKILFILISLLSCNRVKTRFTNEDEFKTYLNDISNGFIQIKKTDDLKFESQLVPSNENGLSCNFRFRISCNDNKPVLNYKAANKDEEMEREGYFSFGIESDVFLKVDGKEIPCSFHHYERNYGIKPSIDMFFSFPNVQPTNNVYLVYRDQVFNQGLIQLEFNKELFTKYYVQ